MSSESVITVGVIVAVTVVLVTVVRVVVAEGVTDCSIAMVMVAV